MTAALFASIVAWLELLNARVPPVAARKLLAPVISIVPRLLIVSTMPPNEFDPLTRQMPPELLLNVAARILKADVPNATSPDMVPELLTMTRPLLLVMLFPLKTPIATLMPLENRVEVIVPEFVRVASCALKLLI